MLVEWVVIVPNQGIQFPNYVDKAFPRTAYDSALDSECEVAFLLIPPSAPVNLLSPPSQPPSALCKSLPKDLQLGRWSLKTAILGSYCISCCAAKYSIWSLWPCSRASKGRIQFSQELYLIQSDIVLRKPCQHVLWVLFICCLVTEQLHSHYSLSQEGKVECHLLHARQAVLFT